MRHTRHYVDELLGDAPLRTVREIPVSEIEPPTDEALNLESLEESIRAHGIIEPLLVARRAADYRVIAGMRRLRAARTVGLNTVPCLVQEVDDDRLLALRGAVLDRITVTAPVIVSELQESERLLSAFPSDAEFELPSGGEAGDVATELRALVDDEIESIRRLRAKIASAASDILSRQELPDRTPVSFQDLMTASVDAVAGEARLRGVRIEIEGPGEDFRMPLDAHRWMASITGLLQAMISRVDRPGAVCRMTATVTVLRPALLLNCAVEQAAAAALDDAAIARYFDPEWTAHPCGASGAVALAALAKTARAHGGRVQVRDNGAVLVVVPRPLDEM